MGYQKRADMGWTVGLVAFLGLASYRITRLLTRDSLTDRIRQHVAVWSFDQVTEQYRSETHRRVAYFVSCPFCVGVYVTAGVYGWWELVPGGRPVILVAAAAGVQAFLASRAGA